MVKKNKADFLDRDGVLVKSIILNKKGYAPRNLKEFKILPKVNHYCKLLKKKGFKLIIVTNQPDISRGLILSSDFNKMNEILKIATNFDDIYVSTSTSNKSYFRKPNPGMLNKAIKKYKLNVKKCFMIGDRASDILAGYTVGCKSIFINRNYAEKKPKLQIKSVNSFAEAARYIIR